MALAAAALVIIAACTAPAPIPRLLLSTRPVHNNSTRSLHTKVAGVGGSFHTRTSDAMHRSAPRQRRRRAHKTRSVPPRPRRWRAHKATIEIAAGCALLVLLLYLCFASGEQKLIRFMYCGREDGGGKCYKIAAGEYAALDNSDCSDAPRSSVASRP